MRKVSECAERKEALANVEAEMIDFRCCLIRQKMQLFNMCIAMLQCSAVKFVQGEDQNETLKRLYEATKEWKYLLECWNTREGQFLESIEAFENVFEKIEGDDLGFDPSLQIEVVIDYLECMRPTGFPTRLSWRSLMEQRATWSRNHMWM